MKFRQKNGTLFDMRNRSIVSSMVIHSGRLRLTMQPELFTVNDDFLNYQLKEKNT